MNVSFDRWDFAALRALLWLIAVLSPLFLVVLPLVTWARGRSLHWTADTGSTRELPRRLVETTGGTRATWTGEVGLSISDPTTGQWLWSLLPTTVLAVAIVTVACLVLRLVTRIAHGSPFVLASVRAMRWVAVVVVVGSVVIPTLFGVAGSEIMRRSLDGGSFSAAYEISLVPVAVGLLVAALAEAFRTGMLLADDVAGLV